MARMKNESVSESFGYCTLKQAALNLQRWIEVYGEDARIDEAIDVSYGDSTGYLEITYSRPYTKDELDAESARKKLLLDRELETYRKLQEKFGGEHG